MLKFHLKSRDSLSHVAELIYPVGSIYMSTNSTSPATLFGFGTWTRITGKFLLGATDSATGSGASYAAGATGGAASVTLTAAQSGVPAHSHDNTIKATTPSLSHSITQPTFNTPELSHTVTQPVLNNNGAHTHTVIDSLGNNSRLYTANYSYSSGDAHMSGWDGRYTSSGYWKTDSQGSHAHTLKTNVAVAKHAATACTRSTNVAVSAHAATDCTMSGSVSNNTAAAATSAHNNMPPFQAVYIWYRSA